MKIKNKPLPWSNYFLCKCITLWICSSEDASLNYCLEAVIGPAYSTYEVVGSHNNIDKK